jgi:hypothetical protein
MNTVMAVLWNDDHASSRHVHVRCYRIERVSRDQPFLANTVHVNKM